MASSSSSARGGSSAPAQQQGTTVISLPEDILGHIHSLMPMRDAAQAACVSHAFLRFWRSYPSLNFDVCTLGLMDLGRTMPSFGPIDKELMALIEDQLRRGVIATFDEYFEKNDPIIQEFSERVDHIMRNHVGTGVKKFRLVPPYGFYINPAVLDRWFQAVIAPGITEFDLDLDMDDDGLGYSFPCSLLSSSSSSSRGCSTITSFSIAGCGLSSLDRVGCLATLRIVRLHRMRVTGEELTCFLSSSPGLQELQLSYCNDVVCLKVPHLLSRLRLLLVRNCSSLQRIGCDAPQLKGFGYAGSPTTHICLGDSVRQVKMSGMDDEPTGMLCYATTKLPSVAPNITSLVLSSCFQIATPMKKLNKLRRLKYLEIHLHTPRRCPEFDFYSLVSILNACPVLATFILRLDMPDGDDAIPGDPHGDSSQRRRHTMGQGHRKLKDVLMSGFPSSAKGLVALTSHILENAASLKHLVLDTAYGCKWRDCIGICSPLTRKALLESRNAVDVIKTYIEDKVPSSVKFKVIEPCAKCHADA